jgi:hypothetical protein
MRGACLLVNNKIITVAGMIFAVMFIGVLSVIMVNLNSTGKKSAVQLGTTYNKLDRTDPWYWDNRVVTGAEVVDILHNGINNETRIIVAMKDINGNNWFHVVANGYKFDGNTTLDKLAASKSTSGVSIRSFDVTSVTLGKINTQTSDGSEGIYSDEAIANSKFRGTLYGEDGEEPAVCIVFAEE